ncbi:MAG: tRNA (guanosine(37)-N1)-methyltransferase TrmD [Magnetococcales bacterium]|nr:tRNA (guanosine(37)-N1)-methyltransferase TrmD [Magnetococcales bacterium]
MKFSILTLFPEMFDGLVGCSILQRAQKQGLIEVARIQIRDFALDRHKSVDDYSFGGGPGMVLKADVLERALLSAIGDGVSEDSLRISDTEAERLGYAGCAPYVRPGAESWSKDEGRGQRSAHVVYLSPQGARFSQEHAVRFAAIEHLVLICGHYEGIDERFVDAYVDEEISLGDFVLTGGEIPAMAMVDAVARMRPGVLGDAQSFQSDSFYESLLDFPHYTRPAQWSLVADRPEPNGVAQTVSPPPVLLSGNHRAVVEWRRRHSLLRTLIRRPDLLNQAELSRVERRLMDRLVRDLAQDLDEIILKEENKAKS